MRRRRLIAAPEEGGERKRKRKSGPTKKPRAGGNFSPAYRNIQSGSNEKGDELSFTGSRTSVKSVTGLTVVQAGAEVVKKRGRGRPPNKSKAVTPRGNFRSRYYSD